jgi:hypothetical protein
VLNIATPGILANDSDPEGHALSISVLTQPANGHLSVALDGGFSYTPDAGYTGIDVFTYSVNDGQADSNTATVQITVSAVNQPPVANNDSYSTPQDTVLSIAAPGVLANDSDPEGHALTMIKDSDPANGTLSINPDGSFSSTEPCRSTPTAASAIHRMPVLPAPTRSPTRPVTATWKAPSQRSPSPSMTSTSRR